MKNLDEDKISKIQEQIKLIAEFGNINAISFYGKYYDFISSLDIPEDIVFLSWFNDYYWNNLLMNSDFNKIVKDNRVKVILIKDIGHYHRYVY